jgi:hypothetical protein
VAALKASVDLLRSAVTESDVHPNPAAPGDAPAAGRRRRPTPPGSDPALTRAERKLKIASAGIGVLIALVSALGAGLGLAWSYIRGYGDERAARALELEEAQQAREEISEHGKRLDEIVEGQTSLSNSLSGIQQELTSIRKYHLYLELHAQYVAELEDAFVHHRKPPAKSKALLAAERDLGIDR